MIKSAPFGIEGFYSAIPSQFNHGLFLPLLEDDITILFVKWAEHERIKGGLRVIDRTMMDPSHLNVLIKQLILGRSTKLAMNSLFSRYSITRKEEGLARLSSVLRSLSESLNQRPKVRLPTT